MDPETQKELVRNLPQILTAIGVILGAYWAYRSNKQSKANTLKLENVENKVDKVDDSVKSVHVDVNGKSEELLKATKDLGQAIGHAEGIKEGHAAGLVDQAPAIPLEVKIVEDPVPVKVVEGDKGRRYEKAAVDGRDRTS